MQRGAGLLIILSISSKFVKILDRVLIRTFYQMKGDITLFLCVQKRRIHMPKAISQRKTPKLALYGHKIRYAGLMRIDRYTMCEFLDGFVHCICFIERFWICDIHRWGHGAQVYFDTSESWI
jgi:hypothetical protein